MRTYPKPVPCLPVRAGLAVAGDGGHLIVSITLAVVQLSTLLVHTPRPSLLDAPLTASRTLAGTETGQPQHNDHASLSLKNASLTARRSLARTETGQP